MAVGMAISSIHQFIAALTLAHLIRCELLDVHVVVGGKHLLRIQEKLRENSFYFEQFFHSAILHEGERPLHLLLEALQEGRGLRHVPNMIFREGNTTFTNPVCEAEPLNDLPHPDFQDTPWRLYLTPHRYIPVRMAEGCYWGKCTFCARYGPPKTVFLDPERALEGLEQLMLKHDVQHVSVNDDCVPPKYWERLCKLVVRRGLPLSMLIWAKPVSGFTAERLELMAEAGIRQIRWGVESAHPRILRLMRKGTTLQTTVRVLRYAKDVGIWNHGCFILGFPTEIEKEAQHTVEFIRRHRSLIHSFILYPFILYEDSYIYHHPEEFMIRDLKMDRTPFFDLIHYTSARGMTPDQARNLALKARKMLLEEAYGHPFWHFLKIREYLQLYINRYGLEATLSMPFERESLRGLPLSLEGVAHFSG